MLQHLARLPCGEQPSIDDAVFAQLRELTALAARMEPDLRAAIGA